MEGNKVFVLIVSVLMILLLPLIIYGFNLNSAAFDEDFYKKEFLKYNVHTNLRNYDIESINNDVLDYLQFEKNNELIKSDFFNEREKIHLLDVKNLIQTISAIYCISIILFLLLAILLVYLLKFNFKIIAKRFFIILFVGSLLTFLDAVLFFILSNSNFNFIFNLFHKTFFSSGSYTFNPELENIVVLYPQNLFFDALIRVILSTIISSTTILFFCAAFLFFLKSIFFKNFFRKIPTKKLKKQKL